MVAEINGSRAERLRSEQAGAKVLPCLEGSVENDRFAFEIYYCISNFSGTGYFGKRNTLVLHEIS